MPNQTLYFNILTFDYPEEEQVFYFNEHEVDRSTRIYKTQFPYVIDGIFPGITEDYIDFVYTTFNEDKEGFMPLRLDFSNENKDLIYQEDIVALDRSQDNDLLMPYSGTYMSIGNKKYLLYTSTRYLGATLLPKEGVPFPVKLAIDCTDPKQIEEPEVIKELIDEVYQFSRMYWKSLTQQRLPVTVTYPAMVAEVAPYFEWRANRKRQRQSLVFIKTIIINESNRS